MRVLVDRGTCEGNAMCMGVAPEVFELDNDGKVRILDDTPPDEMRSKMEDAVRACPTQALSLEE